MAPEEAGQLMAANPFNVVQEYLYGAGAWNPIEGTNVDQPVLPDPTPAADKARRALLDDGSYVAVGGVTAGILPSWVEASLQVVAGDVTYAANNPAGSPVVIENKRFTGNVTVTGQNYTFRNCLFNGPGANPAGTLLRAADRNVVGLVVEDSEFRLADSSITAKNKTAVGFVGHHTTLRRVWFHNVEDGFRPYIAPLNGQYGGDLAFRAFGVVVEDMLFYSPDTVVGGTQSDHQTHCDGMQNDAGGTNIQLVGCTILGMLNPALGDAATPPNPTGVTGSGHISGNIAYPDLYAVSCLIFSGFARAPIGDVLIHRNRLGGGAVTINLTSYVSASGSGITITDNEWLDGARDALKMINRKAELDPYLHVSGNTWGYTGDGHTIGDPYDVRSNG